MAYQAWSVIAGEVPTATKWNILGTNDSGFNTDVNKLKSDKIMLDATDGATVTFDIAQSKIWSITLGGNRTFQVTGITTGTPFFIRVKQGSGGNKTVVWWANIRWPGQTVPTLSNVEGRIDAFMFIPTADGGYDGYFAGFGL